MSNENFHQSTSAAVHMPDDGIWNEGFEPPPESTTTTSSSRRLPCGLGGATSSGSQTDEEIIEDSNGTSPLLNPGTSSDVRVDMPGEDKPASPHDRFPKEKGKTIFACFLVIFSGFLNTLTLSFVHELQDPLPDVGFRHTTYYAIGLNYCEYLMLGSFISVLVLILFHRHRWIVLRRLCFIGSILYLCRCVTMYATVVPLADPNYYCSPKLGENATFWLISRRALEVMAGMGLNLFGKHSLCGDYIYSGHTLVLTISALFIGEYTPRRWKIIHLLSWLVAVSGMALLIISRGHYTIDIILSYWICTRVFWTYHTLAAHPTLRTSQHSHARKEWWFFFFKFMESGIVKPVPRRYDLPVSLPRPIAAYLRRRKANVQ
ncbi:unnamed protein product, partial [Mesorhabditis spiculigera]